MKTIFILFFYLVDGIIESMNEYEATKSCSSYMKILRKVADMETILCSTQQQNLCDGAKTVSNFFTKLVSFYGKN